MNPITSLVQEFYKRQHHLAYKSNWQRLHLDLPLLTSIAILVGLGFIILFSAASEDINVIIKQGIRFGIAGGILFIFAQISPRKYRNWAPWIFLLSILLLIAVLLAGKIGKGAQRWLDLGFLRFQPSEVVKLSVPLMLAWYFHNKILPPRWYHILFAGLIFIIPALLVAKQPDLGTAVMIMIAAGCVLLFAGIGIRWLLLGTITIAGLIPILWHYLHDYQRQRLLTFLSPERDPLGKGYHIIQSKIAIGSGGLFGKGWLNGTQSHLNFLPEHATDFIFAVAGEEFGLLGCIILIIFYFIITIRCLYIANQARDTFSRLLASSLGLTFFLSTFVNIGMVSGILPVVGLPLPLISYGGTSLVTVMASFGIIMSIQTHRDL